MWRVIKATTSKASKDYPCDAYTHIDNSQLREDDYDPEDWKAIQKVWADGEMIRRGDIYLKTKGTWEGEPMTVRSRIDMHEICLKYDLYPDD